VLSIALTGNVAAGKSEVARRLADRGAWVIDADRIVRELQQPGTSVHSAILAHFGDEVRLADGQLDRGRLRERITRSDQDRTALNRIVHPAVAARRAEEVAKAEHSGARVVVNDIPLLFEVLDPSEFELVVLVDASDGVRRSRLVDVRGLAPDAAERLMNTQIPSLLKHARSDLVIRNDGTLADLDRAVSAAWSLIEQVARSA
jgi:dephospho-CoA kinase